MPAFETQQLGIILYDQEAVFEFPRGLPGFDHLRRFAAVHLPKTDPLAGVAVSVTTVPLTKLALQVAPQVMPPVSKNCVPARWITPGATLTGG